MHDTKATIKIISATKTLKTHGYIRLEVKFIIVNDEDVDKIDYYSTILLGNSNHFKSLG